MPHQYFSSHLRYVSTTIIASAAQWRKMAKNSHHKQWVYVIDFTETKCAWGTASNKGDRLIKSGLLQSNLTGKYNRRGDYLMLRIIYGQPAITVYEFSCDAKIPEQEFRKMFHGQTGKGSSCYIGFANSDRDSITSEIFEQFKGTDSYKQPPDSDKKLFDEFLMDFYLAKLKHPINPKRTFYYGDCMEPNFIRKTLNRPDIADAVGRILSVQF